LTAKLAPFVWVLVVLGCKGGDTDPPADTDTDTDDTDAPIDTAPPVPTPDTAPETPVIDCGDLPGPPFANRRIQAARGYHGLAFDSVGNMVGGDNTSLLRFASSTESQILVPNLGSLQQMDPLSDDRFAVAQDEGGNILVVNPDGSRRTVATGIYAYGLTVGPDGMIYTANLDDIHRIDPVSETVEVWLDFPGGTTPKVLDFSPDLSKMYVGTISPIVWQIDLDADLNPVGTPSVFANDVGGWHDGLRVDACGNLYVAEYTNLNLYKITRTGQTSVLVDYQSATGSYGHGIQFGSGIGEWDDHAIYVPQPYDGNRIAEAVIGVPHWTWRGGDYLTINE
jgi:hypothetical protein